MIAAMHHLELAVVTFVFLTAVALLQPVAASEIKAIETGGKGDLTMCPMRGWRRCNLYHHIELPPQMTIGDKALVRFGSNPKEYNFPVARIVHDGSGCAVFSQAAKTENVEKIAVPSCRVVPKAQ